MATYLVGPDDYAGWNPTGRNFALIGAGVGAAGLLSWMSLHHHLGAFRPTAASDKLFLAGLVWLGLGGFCLSAFAALGSMMLSLRSRGTVSITAEGVFRAVQSHTDSLAWSEINGFVPMPYGGVTLISAPEKPNIVIPRSSNDYRACITEIKDHGIPVLPTSSLRQKRKTTWVDAVQNFSFILLSSIAMDSHESHRVRIASFSGAILLVVYVLQTSRSKPDRIGRLTTFGGVLLGFALLALVRTALS